MYGQDEGSLTVHLRQADSLVVPHEVSEIWNTSSRGVRNWQFQQIEMNAARSSIVSEKFLFWPLQLRFRNTIAVDLYQYRLF